MIARNHPSKFVTFRAALISLSLLATAGCDGIRATQSAYVVLPGESNSYDAKNFSITPRLEDSLSYITSSLEKNHNLRAAWGPKWIQNGDHWEFIAGYGVDGVWEPLRGGVSVRVGVNDLGWNCRKDKILIVISQTNNLARPFGDQEFKKFTNSFLNELRDRFGLENVVHTNWLC